MKWKLLCIPHAGGAASAFLRWKPHLHPALELVPIELAGKGKRFLEPPYNSMEEAVFDLLAIVREQAGERYALFGHSMGALLVFELMHAISDAGLVPPVCAFFSGKNPPHVKPDRLRHQLDDDGLWQEVARMGGTPKELLANRELKDLFLPILRRDFRLVETYVPPAGRLPLDCPFVVLYGTGDFLTSPILMPEWEQYSSRPTTVHAVDGGHFFILDQAETVAALVNRTMQPHLSLSLRR